MWPQNMTIFPLLFLFAFTTACTTVQAVMRNVLLCLGFDDRFVHTPTIQQHYVFLVDTLDAKHSGLVGELYQAEVFNREELDNINCEVMSFRQNEKLLSMLSRKTKDQFDKFLYALDNTGQRHVRNHITGRQGQLLCCYILSTSTARLIVQCLFKCILCDS